VKSDQALLDAQAEAVRSRQAVNEIDEIMKAWRSQQAQQVADATSRVGGNQPPQATQPRGYGELAVGEAEQVEALASSGLKQEPVSAPKPPAFPDASAVLARTQAATAAAQAWARCVATSYALARSFPFEDCLLSEAETRLAIEVAVQADFGRIERPKVEYQMNRLRSAMLAVLPARPYNLSRVRLGR
jgi:hypothetical protein